MLMEQFADLYQKLIGEIDGNLLEMMVILFNGKCDEISSDVSRNSEVSRQGNTIQIPGGTLNILNPTN
jgi:hypothetical protein